MASPKLNLCVGGRISHVVFEVLTAVTRKICLPECDVIYFRRVQKTAKVDYQFRHLSCRPSSWKNSAPTGRIFMKFDI
jgi:hypothetical protein